MRAVQVLTQSIGGPVDHAVDVAMALAWRGHDSHVVGPPSPALSVAAEHGVRVHRASMHAVTDLRGAARVMATLRRIRPDIVHLQDRRAGLIGRALAAASSVPAVYTLHGVPDSLAPLIPGNLGFARPRPWDRAAYLWAEQMLSRCPRSVVVTPCEALAGYARDAVGIGADRVRVVPNGVGDRWLAVPAQSPGRPQRDPRGRLPGRRVTAVWLGVMAPVKRVPDLIGVLARVPGLDLVLVGDGPDRARVEDLAEAAGCRDRVRLTGHVDAPEAELRRADLFVLPSAAEACPLALLQAMACGRPVVASGVGGVPEIVRDGVDGVLLPPGHRRDWIAALTDLTADASKRAAMGAAARERVVDRFTLGRNVDALEAVYREVLA